MGHHPDVVIGNDGRAYLFYFTHQGGRDLDAELKNSAQRTVMQVAELEEMGGVLRNKRDLRSH